MELTLNFTGPPPLLCITAEESGGTAPPAKNSSPQPPQLPLLLSSIEKNTTTLLTTTLSLGSLNPNPSPKKPNKDDSGQTNTLISESTTQTQSIVTQEEDTQVVAKKIDQECTAESTKKIKLFGVALEYYRDSDGVSVKKRKMDGDDLLRQEDSDKYLLVKKRACFRIRGDDDHMTIKMRKVLTESDVNTSSRFLLGNKVLMIEQILSSLNLSVETFGNSDHGEKIKVYDMDMKTERSLVLKRWKTNSFVINGGWTKYFVIERKLKKSDEIELSWDQTSKRLNFSVLKRAAPHDPED